MADPNKITGQRLHEMLELRKQKNENLKKSNVIVSGVGTGDNIHFRIDIGTGWYRTDNFELVYTTKYETLKELDEKKVEEILDTLEDFINVFVTGEGYESFIGRYAGSAEDEGGETDEYEESY